MHLHGSCTAEGIMQRSFRGSHEPGIHSHRAPGATAPESEAFKCALSGQVKEKKQRKREQQVRKSANKATKVLGLKKTIPKVFCILQGF